MKPRLQDIAQDTGYSISTVSRVLRGSEKISKKAQKKIFESAQRLNYPLNRLNNGIQPGMVNVAMVATSFHEGEFYASLLYGFNEAAEAMGIQFFMMSVERHRNRLNSILQDLSNLFDGIILFAPDLTHEQYKEIQRKLPKNYPVVSNGLMERPVFVTVTFDSYSGGHLAAVKYEKKGYHKVGVIKGPWYKTEARFRYNGFSDYVQHHAEMELLWEFEGDYLFDSGYEAFRAFHRLPEKPEAIFSSNDLMAHGFIEGAKETGYRIPEDVAIIGYDDLPYSRQMKPKLSTIKTDLTALGEATLKSLQDQMKNGGTQQRGMLSFIPVELVLREST